MKTLLKKYYKIIERWYYSLIYVQNYIDSFFVTTNSVIRREIQGNIPERSKDKLCIFAHYDKHQIIDDYVLHHIKKLYESGCEIVFVSSSKSFLQNEIEKIKDFCSKVIIRKNRGIDFGSWKVGLERVKELNHYNQLILMNDSIYGPFFDLSSIFEKMEEKNLDMWGITESWEHAYHIQSYFIVFNSKIIHSNFFKNFWNRVRFFQNKNLVIRLYEIGLSQNALQFGFKLGSFCDYPKIVNFTIKNYADEFPYTIYAQILKTRNVNPSHFLWDILIKHFGCPFLKIELVRDNPSEIINMNIHEMRAVLEMVAPHYDINMIINHLKRIKCFG